MTLIVKRMALVVSLVVLTLSSVAMAGHTFSGGSCYANSDGSGYCNGNFLGFRASSQSAAYAVFADNSSGPKGFYARYMPPGSTTYSYYSCVPNAAVAAIWDRAMALEGYFHIYWDSSGTCYNLYIENGSPFSNF